jgi:hypothetical protein
VCTGKYLSTLNTLVETFEKEEISFLEYQILTYKAIDDIIEDYRNSYDVKSKMLAERSNLLGLWIYGDQLVLKMKGPPYIDSHYEKLELIGKYLTKEYIEKRKANVRCP